MIGVCHLSKFKVHCLMFISQSLLCGAKGKLVASDSTSCGQFVVEIPVCSCKKIDDATSLLNFKCHH